MNTLMPLTDRDSEYLVDILNRNWEMCEHVTAANEEFARFEMTHAQRNAIILRSQYRNDPQLVAALTLFG